MAEKAIIWFTAFVGAGLLQRYNANPKEVIELPRVKRGVTARRKHKKVLEITKGQRGTRSKLFRRANEAMLHSLAYAYRDRRARKRDFRKLWITRINAAARAVGMSYSQLVSTLSEAGIEINRKMLAEMAISDPTAFARLVESAKSAAQA